MPRPAAARVPPASLGRRLGRSAAGNATDESTKWFSPADADPQVSRPPRCWSRIGRRTCVLSRQGPVARPRPCPRWRPRRLGSRVGARRQVDVFLVRKLGVPQWRELAMGALASGGGVVMNDDVVSSLRITDQQVRAAIDSETAELQRRELAYRGGRPVVDPRARIVILVDDGIATGASMLAAVRTIRATDRSRSSSRSRSVRPQPAASSRRKPTTWCAQPCRQRLRPSARSITTFIRSPTTRSASCSRRQPQAQRPNERILVR